MISKEQMLELEDNDPRIQLMNAVRDDYQRWDVMKDFISPISRTEFLNEFVEHLMDEQLEWMEVENELRRGE